MSINTKELKSKYVLSISSEDGTIYTLDVLDPKSTLFNPILDLNRIGLGDSKLLNYVIHPNETNYSSISPMSISPMSISPMSISSDDETHTTYDNDKLDRDIDYQIDDSGIFHEIETVKISTDNDDISRKIIDRSIMSDMIEMTFPDEVKIKANNIHSKFNVSTKRGDRRKRMIFVCIYYAYKELNIPPDNINIARVIGIDPKTIGKAFSECAPPNTGYTPPYKSVKCVDYIPTYFHLTGLSDQNCNDAVLLGKEIIAKDKSLKDEIPQIVATGILLYFMEINGVTSDKDFPDALGKSALTLSNMKKKIEAVHNA